jgi:hypothetical protein
MGQTSTNQTEAGRRVAGGSAGVTSSAGGASLRISEEDKRELIRALNQLGATPKHLAERKHTRYELPKGYAVLATITQVGGSTTQSVLTVRDVSNAGIAFIHPHYLSVGTTLTLVFVGVDRQPMIRISATVRRCAHVRGMAHDVGASFSHPVEIAEMLELGGVGEGSAALAGAVAAAKASGAGGGGEHLPKAGMSPELAGLVDQLVRVVAQSSDPERVIRAVRAALAAM